MEGLIKAARISKCGKYRYNLLRDWADRALLPICMLNPSKADAVEDDPTIRRVSRFAERDGFGGIFVVNLYAFRATDPAELWLQRHGDIVGPENDREIVEAAEYAKDRCGKIVVAWGADPGPIRDRDRDVLKLIAAAGAVPHAWKVTRDGHPGHPLYLPADSRLLPFSR